MPGIPIPEVVAVDVPDDVMILVPERIPVEIRPDGKVLIRADDLRHVRAVRVSESRLCKLEPERLAGRQAVDREAFLIYTTEEFGCFNALRGSEAVIQGALEEIAKTGQFSPWWPNLEDKDEKPLLPIKVNYAAMCPIAKWWRTELKHRGIVGVGDR